MPQACSEAVRTSLLIDNGLIDCEQCQQTLSPTWGNGYAQAPQCFALLQSPLTRGEPVQTILKITLIPAIPAHAGGTHW